ncbi:MAG: Tetratricopeptide 2 [Tardiphaga sp.]|uniref:tetratricopeptide repeat protein n=1 Tax=Tardiphaga sp. TaxID=1926292 RepID=UPI0026291908|nr:tetratricopeptide repeat protein [Tardiphaga sp.]MDB5502068.1 Tetratricopeptide 2 [Tardiphaga sp.]
MRQPSCLARLFTTAAVATILAVGLAGCKTAGMSDVTGSIGGKTERALEADPARAADALGEKFRSNPRDADVALRYGQALRASGQRTQAVAVFEQATLLSPGNKALLAGYGRALADTGSFQRAFEVLTSAHTPANPDWRILSVQGAVLDQMGRHDEARRYYASALKIRPDEPSVLSNLGLSYMLSKDLPKAESTLRQAYSGGGGDPRVRQNLGLVVGLQGRFGEAETIVKADLPPEEAAANVAYLKQMLSSKSQQLGAQSEDTRGRS